MASTLNPYINFDGTARQALELYRSVFGGELHVNTFGEYGMGEGPDAEKVMHGQLEAPGGLTIMAADTPQGMERTVGTNMSVSLSGSDGDELRRWWQGLSEGGTVTMPLEKQMWGDEFGMCTDRFGVPWMVNIVAQQG
jgi:PhnB protein